MAATSASHCVVAECCGLGSLRPPFPPTAEKRIADWSGSTVFEAIGFTPVGGLYGSYVLATNINAPSCGGHEGNFWGPCGDLVYIAFGVTDLDGDGVFGGYSMQIRVRGDELYRQPAFGSVEQGLAAFPDFGSATCPFCADGFVE